MIDHGSAKNPALARAVASEPRHSEGSLAWSGGELLLAWSAFSDAAPARVTGSAADREWTFSRDNNAAEIRVMRSADCGLTWETAELLVPNDAGINTMQPAFASLPDGRLGLSYSSRDSPARARRLFVSSDDGGRTWSHPVDMTGLDGYVTAAHHRMRAVGDRLIQPCHQLRDDELGVVIAISDDLGRSWQPGARLTLPSRRGAHQRGLWEASICEAPDGDLLLVGRTSSGYVAAARSSDRGDTWSRPSSTGVTAPSAPSVVERIGDDLMLLHNTGFDPTALLGGPRTRLAHSWSSDGGRTWGAPRMLFEDPDRWFHYPAALVVDDMLLLLVSVTDPSTRLWDLRFERIPLDTIRP